MPRSAATCRGRRPHAAVGGHMPRSAARLPRSAASSRGLRPVGCRGRRPRCRGRRPRAAVCVHVAAVCGHVAAVGGPVTTVCNVAADRGSRPPTAATWPQTAARGRRPRQPTWPQTAARGRRPRLLQAADRGFHRGCRGGLSFSATVH